MSTTSKSGNGTGQTLTTADAENALTQALADLKGDLRSLRDDIDAIKRDGAQVGRSSVRAAQDAASAKVQVANAKVQGVREDVVRTVRTVEDDVAAIANDLTNQVQRNPYATLGVAVLGGMLLSRLLKKD